MKDLAEKRIKTHQTPNSCSLSCSEYWQLINFIINKQQGGNPSGKVGEFDIGQGKVREIRKSGEIVVCLWCARHHSDSHKINITRVLLSIVDMHKMD